MSSTQKSGFSSAKRVLATAASAAMIFALLPAGIAMGESPANVCPPPGGVETFPDVEEGATHEDNIECLAGYDLGVGGYPDGTYRPGQDVFRAQMATFIVALIEGATGEEMPAGEDAFPDDEQAVAHEHNINKLAEAGVVQGQDGQYNPARKVDRAAMASFIAQAIDYVDDQTVEVAGNSVLGPPEADHFTDDEASPHEDNINRLADHGIVEGQDLPTTYNPANIVFRGQMASFIMQAASVLEAEGLWAANDVAPTTNQDFTATPSDAAENTVSESSGTNANRGTRQYSVSGLDDATTYDLRLFPAENVSEDANGVVTFVDDNENSTAGDGEADIDEANVVAKFEVVNGSAVGTQDEHVQASPVNGTITFTIDSEATDSVIPAIWVDTEADDTIELDADNQPTEDFGIAGKKSWIPAEASQGSIGTADVDIASVNKDLDRLTTASATYFYDANDTFYVFSTTQGAADGDEDNPACPNAARQVTMTGFETELSTGDELDDDTVYQTDDALSSVFCLEDLSPAAPSITAVDEQTEDGGEVTLTGVLSGATVTVYCEEDANDDDNETVTTSSTKCAESATDADTSEANFQIVLTGLKASTNYDIAANQTKDGETSALSTENEITTTAVGVAARPTLTNSVLTKDAGLQGVIDTGDIWTLTFDQNMANSTATNGAFVVEDPDGDRYQIDCSLDNDASTSRVEADCTLLPDSSGNADRVLRIEIEDTSLTGDEDLSGTSTGDNLAEYPATIINVNDSVEDDQGDNLDLANSADKVVDRE